jgi:hypothetical protein
VRDLLGGLDDTQSHRGLGDVGEAAFGKRRFELAQRLGVEMVRLDPDRGPVLDQLADRLEVIVALPVGIDDVPIGMATPPRLAAIDVRRDRRRRVLVDDQRVVAPEPAVEEIAVVADVVVGGENRRVSGDPFRISINDGMSMTLLPRNAVWLISGIIFCQSKRQGEPGCYLVPYIRSPASPSPGTI